MQRIRELFCGLVAQDGSGGWHHGQWHGNVVSVTVLRAVTSTMTLSSEVEKLRNDRKNSSELFFQFGGSSLVKRFADFPKKRKPNSQISQ